MPSYKLVYFNGRGRAELARLIFAAAGAEYTDHRVADWPATKSEAPLGQLPYLEVDGVRLPQSVAVARFVAREFNLAGRNNLEQAQADAIVDTVIELVNQYYSKVFPVQDPAEKEAAFKAFVADQLTKGVANVEKLVSLYGSNGHAVGDSLTWADLLIHDIALSLFEKVPDFKTNHPLLAAVHESVAQNERVSTWIKNRPVTPF